MFLNQLSFLTLVWATYLSFLIQDSGSLQCYECNNEHSNMMCVGEHNLHECEDDMDTCQTIVDYSDATEMMSITKTCTKNESCFLQKFEHSNLPCISDNKQWMCIECCGDDGCNINEAHQLMPLNLFILFLCFFILAVRN